MPLLAYTLIHVRSFYVPKTRYNQFTYTSDTRETTEKAGEATYGKAAGKRARQAGANVTAHRGCPCQIVCPGAERLESRVES